MARGTRGLYQRRSYFYFKYKNEHGLWVERATRTPILRKRRRSGCPYYAR
ncbi:MAG: hypothetical protein ACXWCK_32490 [Burkholderiales bacterium]